MSSRPFANSPAKPAFAQFNESQTAGDYINDKKIKYTFCNQSICHPNKNVYSESNLLMLRRANNLAFYPCINSFDKTQLYVNLYTELKLNPTIPVVTNMQTNTSPAIINPTLVPYLTYNIDANGNLFGNSVCGIDNYLNYLVYNNSNSSGQTDITPS